MPEPHGADHVNRHVVSVLGLPFDVVSLGQAEWHVREAVQNRRRLFLSTPNLNFVIAARADPAFRRSVLESDLSLADGMPIVWVARALGLPLRERVAGSDLFEALRRSPIRPAIKVFFFGGEEGAAEAAAEAINAARGGLCCVGHLYPGFGSIEDMSAPDVIDAINATSPDFVVVALGARKGQEWIQRNRHRLEAPVISHLGAVVNFQSERVRRAPRWAARVGAEWLWRILQEPPLWRRYWSDGVAFLGLVFSEVMPLLLARVPRFGEEPGSAIVSAGAGPHSVRLSGRLSRGLAARLDQCGALSRIELTDSCRIDAWGAAELSIWLAMRARDGSPVVVASSSARVVRALRRLGCSSLVERQSRG